MQPSLVPPRDQLWKRSLKLLQREHLGEAGAFWHRPRGPSLVELGPLAEDARCPPPHLRVVGVVNSCDPSLVRRREEAKRRAR